MMYVIYILSGLAGGVLTGMAGLTAAMVLPPILCGVCGWSGYDAVTLSLIANVPSAMGAAVDLIPGIVVTVMCTVGAVGSARFANTVEEKVLNRTAGAVLIAVSVVSWVLSA